MMKRKAAAFALTCKIKVGSVPDALLGCYTVDIFIILLALKIGCLRKNKIVFVHYVWKQYSSRSKRTIGIILSII